MKRYTEYICFRNASQRIVRVPYHLYHISIFLLFIKYNGRNVFFCFSHVMPLNCFLVRISKVYIIYLFIYIISLYLYIYKYIYI